MTKYTFIIGFKHENKEEEIESDYLPTYKADAETGEVFLYICGKECDIYYYATEVYIKCIYERA